MRSYGFSLAATLSVPCLPVLASLASCAQSFLWDFPLPVLLTRDFTLSPPFLSFLFLFLYIPSPYLLPSSAVSIITSCPQRSLLNLSEPDASSSNDQ
jgi:hypothetical protein